MPADARLSPHFFLSHLTVSPHAGRSGMRNEPLGVQFDNLRRMAQTLELVSWLLNGCQVHVLRAFQRATAPCSDASSPAADGRSVEFIAPEFGSPRDVCAHLVAHGLHFERLVNAGDWIQLDIPRFGQASRLQLQTGVFEYGRPMQYLEGLL